MRIPKKMSLETIKEHTDQKFVDAVVKYFNEHPKKTVFKVKKGFTVRKYDGGWYTVHLT